MQLLLVQLLLVELFLQVCLYSLADKKGLLCVKNADFKNVKDRTRRNIRMKEESCKKESCDSCDG